MTNKLPLDPKQLTRSVAMIGLPAAGKTTLATVLANRLVDPDAYGACLVPSDHNTFVEVQRNWTLLQNREWPESTRSASRPSMDRPSLTDLRWRLQVGKAGSCELRLADVAGQDLIHIFTDDRAATPDRIDAALRSVFDYCRSADTVMVLVNFGDFIGEGDAQLSIVKQAAMKAAFDLLQADNLERRVCLLLTQAGLYTSEARARGGWDALLKSAMPFVYNAHLRNRAFPVFPVSAVHDTEIVNEAVEGPRRVPKPGFRSRGLDEVIEWLVASVKRDQDRAYSAVRPVPVLVECNAEWRGLLQKTMTWIGTIRNDGADGYIRVIATAQRHGKDVERRFMDIELRAGQSEEISIRLTDTTDKDGKDGVTVSWALVELRA